MHSNKMGEAVILLGSNIDPARNIRLGALELKAHLSVIKASSVWLTPAVGTTGPDFYNAAVTCTTDLDADSIKFTILRPIEEKLGRVRTTDKYAPRTIDLDVIILNNQVLDKRLWKTAFMFLPIAEITPDFPHPDGSVTLAQIASRLAPTSGARRIQGFSLF